MIAVLLLLGEEASRLQVHGLVAHKSWTDKVQLHNLNDLNTSSFSTKVFQLLLHREWITQKLRSHGRCYPPHILQRAWVYQALDYADLAAFDAFTVYTCCLKVLSDEFVTDLDAHGPDGSLWLSELDDEVRQKQARTMLGQACVVLVDALHKLGPMRDLTMFQDKLDEIANDLGISNDDFERPEWLDYLKIPSQECGKQTRFGMSRREIYPWSAFEPDRNATESVQELNEYLSTISNDIEARVTALTAFNADGKASNSISYQLGLFAKHNLVADREVLSEKSILTAIRPLEDAICDACGQELDSIPYDEVRQCDGEDCDVPFCSEECKQRAAAEYHKPNLESEEDAYDDEHQVEAEGNLSHEGNDASPSSNGGDHSVSVDQIPITAPFCGNTDLSTIGRPTNTDTPEWDLYFLLLTRAISMSLTQTKHPLSFTQTKYLWGDFHASPFCPTFPDSTAFETPRSLPFSTQHSLEYTLDYFTTLSLSDARATPYSPFWLDNFDFWIVQTLFAKFRGVANASQSTFDGKAEIASVHLGWCLANHSCAPNVRWTPKGTRKFLVRNGIKKDEEVFSHYTDVRLGVKERRERLREVLGGECQCERCTRESAEHGAAKR